MSKRVREKALMNCGQKRMYDKAGAQAQKKAREYAGQVVRIYKCEKCHHYHTTSISRRGFSPFSKIWSRL